MPLYQKCQRSLHLDSIRYYVPLWDFGSRIVYLTSIRPYRPPDGEADGWPLLSKSGISSDLLDQSGRQTTKFCKRRDYVSAEDADPWKETDLGPGVPI